MHSDFDPHVIDNPPMPYEQYRDKAFLTFAKQLVWCIFAGLVLAGLIAATRWGY